MPRQIPLLLCLLLAPLAQAQSLYTPPASAVAALDGLRIEGLPTGAKFKARFAECDTRNTCDGKPLKYGCSSDRNRNTALLDLGGKAVFYDAKMGLDADGSPYAQRTPGQTDQPQTSLRYPLPGRPSINADRVPFIVIPLGGFDQALGVKVGDVAAVVHGGKRSYAVVADRGPTCKIGEGSIQLHEALGHTVCRTRDANGDCTKLRNAGLEGEVLYFIFPGTHAELLDGLAPDNINTRIETIGARAWQALQTP